MSNPTSNSADWRKDWGRYVELRKDKARLDWLACEYNPEIHLSVERSLERDFGPEPLRAVIDKAMEEDNGTE